MRPHAGAGGKLHTPFLLVGLDVEMRRRRKIELIARRDVGHHAVVELCPHGEAVRVLQSPVATGRRMVRFCGVSQTLSTLPCTWMRMRVTGNSPGAGTPALRVTVASTMKLDGWCCGGGPGSTLTVPSVRLTCMPNLKNSLAFSSQRNTGRNSMPTSVWWRSLTYWKNVQIDPVLGKYAQQLGKRNRRLPAQHVNIVARAKAEAGQRDRHRAHSEPGTAENTGTSRGSKPPFESSRDPRGGSD